MNVRSQIWRHSAPSDPRNIHTSVSPLALVTAASYQPSCLTERLFWKSNPERLDKRINVRSGQKVNWTGELSDLETRFKTSLLKIWDSEMKDLCRSLSSRTQLTDPYKADMRSSCWNSRERQEPKMVQRLFMKPGQKVFPFSLVHINC